MTSAIPAAAAILKACFAFCFNVVFITAMLDAPRGNAPRIDAKIPIKKYKTIVDGEAVNIAIVKKVNDIKTDNKKLFDSLKTKTIDITKKTSKNN